MQQSDVYYQLLSQHVSGIIMPIFRRSKTVCYCIWCTTLFLLDVVGSGCEAVRCRIRAAYAHLQENKGPVTAFGMFWFCWMWLVAVVGRCVVGCEQLMPIFRRTKALLLHLVCCSGSAGCGW